MYVIKRLSDDMYFNGITLSGPSFWQRLYWHINSNTALHLSSVEEAKAVIEFLIDVINYEYDGDLIVVRVAS